MRPRTRFSASSGLFLASLLTAAAVAQTSAPTSTLSVDVRLVVVPVTVRDKKEHLIRTLNKEDFTVTADGKPQPIRYFDREDDLPLTLGLLVDISGSQRSVLDAERTASSAFLDGMLQPGRDQAFIVEFGHTADLLSDITPSLPKLQAALQKVEGDTDRPTLHDNTGDSQDNGNGSNPDPQDRGGGGGRRGDRGGSGRGSRGGPNGSGTVLYDAVYLSSNEVLKKAPATKPAEDAVTSTTAAAPKRKALILLTDGDDRGSKESLTDAIEAAQRNDTTLYAIYYKGENGGGGGFGGGFPGGGFPGGRGGGFPGGGGRAGGPREERNDGKKILERMADETGGRVYEVSKKMTLAEIYRQIAEELRSQYRIGFSPTNNDEGYHKLVVDTPTQKKLILQARDGYYTGAAK